MNLFDYICTINISIQQLFFMRILKAIFLVIFTCAVLYCYCYFPKNWAGRILDGKIGSYAYSLDSLNKKKELAKYDSLVKNMCIHFSNGNYHESIRLGEEAVEICEKILGKEHSDYADQISTLALIYNYSGNYLEAIRFGEETLKIYEKIQGKEHPDYAESITSLADFYNNNGNYSEAIRLGEKSAQIYEKILGKEHPDYAALINRLAIYYSNAGNYSEAFRMGQEALLIRERILSKEHPDYVISLSNLALYYCRVGNYSEAIRLGMEVLQIEEMILGKEHHNYATSLNNLAYYYSHTGNYSEAIRMGREALVITEKKWGKEHPKYSTSLHNLALYFWCVGNYSEAIRMGREALMIRERILGKEHPHYAMSLSNLALYYSRVGNYSEAIRLGMEVLQIEEMILGKEHHNYATSLNNLAYYYSHTGNYSEAIRMGREALVITEKKWGKEHPKYSTSLHNLALYFWCVGNYSEAIRMGREALMIRERILGKEHPHYAMSLSTLAFLYSNANNYSEAIRLGYEALLIFEKIHGKEHPDYTTALSCLALIYKSSGNLSKFHQLWYDYINIMLEQTKGYFSELPSYERNTYWKRIDHNFKVETPYFAFESNCNDFTDLCYNSVLISKGIILDTEKEFSKLIVDNKDNFLDSLVQEYRNIRMFLHKLYEKPISERYVNTDSLEREASLLEHELISKSKAIGDYTHNLAIDWKQVRDSLGKRDVAVEFIKFPIPETDSVMYCALTLRQGYQKPKMILLFEASELQLIQSHNYYTTTTLSKLIWEPLDAEISGAENIYFAADGELYNIAIESLLHYDQKKQEDVRMCEKWNMYRLSSTREIAKRRSEKLPVKANQYGGLDYSADIASLEHQSKLYDNHAYTYERSVPDSLGVRGEFGPLTHTLSEVQYIDSLYKQHGIASKVYTGQDGSEPSFKHLSGQHITNLHIATHGFYWSESDMENSPKSFMRFLNAMDEGLRHREDKAMTRTGLCLSGANAIFSNDIPDDVDDGFITAREISNLNLHGLDLVVLSACQTALGELKGDGVYGLQRGFKQAGAETIIMSLWKVDDLATMILMKEFYKCYLSGDSKRDAFMKAQNKVRTFDEMVDGVRRNFSSPKYWAAFIMLDGLE